MVPLIISVLILGSVTPLTSEQRVRLETARDGRDYQEEAFVALVENVATWAPGGPGDEPIRLEMRLDDLVADPAGRRGELYHLRGVLQQRTRLPRPHAEVEEWFLRHDQDDPFLVYVLRSNSGDIVRDGSPIELDARFYKTVEFVARDGRPRTYAAFVGALPRLERAPTGGVVSSGLVAVLAGLGAIFLVLLLATRRKSVRARVRVTPEPAGDDDTPLPNDPADALAELHRRAEGGEG